jgi:hypothetical protein
MLPPAGSPDSRAGSSLYPDLKLLDQSGRAVLCQSDRTSDPDGACTASTRQLEKAIRDYIKTVNDDPRPFRWTKPADDILASVKRLRRTIMKIADNQTKNTET